MRGAGPLPLLAARLHPVHNVAISGTLWLPKYGRVRELDTRPWGGGKKKSSNIGSLIKIPLQELHTGAIASENPIYTPKLQLRKNRKKRDTDKHPGWRFLLGSEKGQKQRNWDFAIDLQRACVVK